MDPNSQLHEFITSMRNQGYSDYQIREMLAQAGWNASIIQQVLPERRAPRNKLRGKIILLLILLVVTAASLGVFSILSKKDSAAKGTTPAAKDITTQIDPGKYQQVTGLRNTTFWLSKQWTVAPTSDPTSGMSLYNYTFEAVKTELKADGRYPTNANFYHDIKKRELKTYPFSLDKMHEVQIFSTTPIAPAPVTKGEIERLSSSFEIKDLQLYKVNGTLVADYIRPGKNGLIDQRIIILRNPAGDKDISIIINPDQSRSKITKENFDGLMELVGSVKFTN